MSLENSGGEETDNVAVDEIFEVNAGLIKMKEVQLFSLLGPELLNICFYSLKVALDASKSCPLVLFVKDVEKAIGGNYDAGQFLRSKLENLPENVVVIGSHIHPDSRKEKVISLILIRDLELFGGSFCY